ncbi:hypothetical protein CHU92_02950 [Flavobacterium cyanobacteriorum]|uniref:Uncharacterized protein n=1 Tax=Flavobacterium cyanobacteriorum TaxID=2022802 RepID=A0A255ZQM4_9FLAO|nr:hypothetical protein [Flavobacterium cyanobacteriorum]OYQ43803.1 hypothetical protein CHU92_02950 [Flavobacterium cyanobacteriorum]
MKKNITKGISFLFIAAMIISCSQESTATDESVVVAGDNPVQNYARGSVWDDVLGIDNQDGTFSIVPDKQLLLKDMQDILDKGGMPTTLVDIIIVEKSAVNNPSDKALMIVGLDNQGTSIGIWLRRAQQESFELVLDKTFDLIAIACRGCTDGCNLQYLTIDGKKVPYCNENGCMIDCDKLESSF